MTATTASDTQIDLAWSDNASDETSQTVERSTTGAGGPFSTLQVVGANIESHSDTGLSASTEYCYRVFASNAGGDSAASNVDCATTDAPAGATEFPAGDYAQEDSCKGLFLHNDSNVSSGAEDRCDAAGQAGDDSGTVFGNTIPELAIAPNSPNLSRSFDFDGTGDYVASTDDAAFESTAMLLSMWVEADTLINSTRISKGQATVNGWRVSDNARPQYTLLDELVFHDTDGLIASLKFNATTGNCTSEGASSVSGDVNCDATFAPAMEGAEWLRLNGQSDIGGGAATAFFDNKWSDITTGIVTLYGQMAYTNIENLTAGAVAYHGRAAGGDRGPGLIVQTDTGDFRVTCDDGTVAGTDISLTVNTVYNHVAQYNTTTDELTWLIDTGSTWGSGAVATRTCDGASTNVPIDGWRVTAPTGGILGDGSEIDWDDFSACLGAADGDKCATSDLMTVGLPLHLAVFHDQGNVRWYVNGQLTDQTYSHDPTNDWDTSSLLRLFADFSGGSNPNGRGQEMAYFDFDQLKTDVGWTDTDEKLADQAAARFCRCGVRDDATADRAATCGNADMGTDPCSEPAGTAWAWEHDFSDPSISGCDDGGEDPGGPDAVCDGACPSGGECADMGPGATTEVLFWTNVIPASSTDHWLTFCFYPDHVSNRAEYENLVGLYGSDYHRSIFVRAQGGQIGFANNCDAAAAALGDTTPDTYAMDTWHEITLHHTDAGLCEAWINQDTDQPPDLSHTNTADNITNVHVSRRGTTFAEDDEYFVGQRIRYYPSDPLTHPGCP